jgi:hypothetical protein
VVQALRESTQVSAIAIPSHPLTRPQWEEAFVDFIPAVAEAIHGEEDTAAAPIPMEEALPLENYLLAHPISKMTYEGEELVITSLPDSPPVPLETAQNWAEWLGMDFSGTVEYTSQFYIPKEWQGGPVRLEIASLEHAAAVLIDNHVAGHLIQPPWRLMLDPLEFGAHTLTIRVTNSPANVAAVTFGPEAKQDPDQAAWFAKALEAMGGGLRGPVYLRRMTYPDQE